MFMLVGVVTVAILVSFGWVGIRLRGQEAGPERDALLTSLWSLAGTAGILVSIATGVPPFSVALAPRVLVLGAGVGLLVTGRIKSSRLAAAREHELLRAGTPAESLAERVDALEVRRSRYGRIPLRTHIARAGAKVFAAGMALSIMPLVRSGTMTAILGAFAAVHIGWLGWDLLASLERKFARDRVDEEISQLLEPDARRVREDPGEPQ
jgi:hypothetical protein